MIKKLINNIRNKIRYNEVKKLYYQGKLRNVIKDDAKSALDKSDLLCTYHGMEGMVRQPGTDWYCKYCMVEVVNQYTANMYKFAPPEDEQDNG